MVCRCAECGFKRRTWRTDYLLFVVFFLYTTDYRNHYAQEYYQEKSISAQFCKQTPNEQFLLKKRSNCSKASPPTQLPLPAAPVLPFPFTELKIASFTFPLSTTGFAGFLSFGLHGIMASSLLGLPQSRNASLPSHARWHILFRLLPRSRHDAIHLFLRHGREKRGIPRPRRNLEQHVEILRISTLTFPRDSHVTVPSQE